MPPIQEGKGEALGQAAGGQEGRYFDSEQDANTLPPEGGKIHLENRAHPTLVPKWGYKYRTRMGMMSQK